MTVDIDERKLMRNEFGLWIGWTLATTVGMLLGLLPFILFVENLDLLLARILVPLVAGLLVGVLQWLVLQQFMTRTVDWILHGGVGWAVGYAFGLIVIEFLGKNPLGAIVGYLLFGLIVGLIQWPILQREIPNALPWVFASMIGWAAGALISQGFLNLITPDTGEPISQVLSSAVISGGTGLIAGAITGLALIWLVRGPDVRSVKSSREA